MAEQVEELVVAAKAEGLEETSEGFEEMEADMDEVADGMEDTTGQLAELEQRFTGAMGAILVGIGALTAGLLSQIPVVGEVLAGLSSVVDAIAFRLDERLRPALEPISDIFFKISEAIFEVDGPLGKLIDTVLVGSVVFGLLAGAAGAASLAMTGLAAVVAGLSAPFLIVAAAVGLLVGAIATDFLGVRTRLITAIKLIDKVLSPVADMFIDIAHAIADIGGSAIEFTVDLVGSAIKRVMQISDFVTDIAGEFYEFTANLAGNALLRVKEIGNFVTDVLGGFFEFTVNLTGNALRFVKNILNKLQKIANNTWNTVIEISLELLEGVQNAGEEVAGPTGPGIGIGVGFGVVQDIVEGLSSSGGGGLSQASGQSAMFLDGRRVDEQTGRHAQSRYVRR